MCSDRLSILDKKILSWTKANMLTPRLTSKAIRIDQDLSRGQARHQVPSKKLHICSKWTRTQMTVRHSTTKETYSKSRQMSIHIVSARFRQIKGVWLPQFNPRTIISSRQLDSTNCWFLVATRVQLDWLCPRVAADRSRVACKDLLPANSRGPNSSQSKPWTSTRTLVTIWRTTFRDWSTNSWLTTTRRASKSHASTKS